MGDFTDLDSHYSLDCSVNYYYSNKISGLASLYKRLGNKQNNMKKIKKYLLRKLWLWWVNEDNGRELRGTQIEQQVGMKIFS